MAKRKKRVFTPEFKADAVRLVKVGDRSVSQIARDLDVVDSVLRDWVSKALGEVQAAASGVLHEDERRELLELRREVRRLREDKEILKKAAAFFARENA